MKLIAAVDKNWAIGYKNQLLDSIPSDMKQFRQKTTGHIVVMGRKTLESFPGGLPLKNRRNIVLTSNRNYQVKDAVIVHSEEELKEYMDHFTLKGGGGTDFRPVFSYVEQLRAQGELRDLKGLLYFTDGEGEYPKRRTEYETAFLFLKETDPGAQFPPWALRLVIPEEEQDMWEQQGEQDHEH